MGIRTEWSSSSTSFSISMSQCTLWWTAVRGSQGPKGCCHHTVAKTGDFSCFHQRHCLLLSVWRWNIIVELLLFPRSLRSFIFKKPWNKLDAASSLNGQWPHPKVASCLKSQESICLTVCPSRLYVRIRFSFQRIFKHSSLTLYLFNFNQNKANA